MKPKFAVPAHPTDVEGLCILADALRLASAAITGIQNQPRARNTPGVEQWFTFISLAREQLIQRIREVTPEDEEQAFIRAEALIEWDFDCGRSLADMAASLATLAVQVVPA